MEREVGGGIGMGNTCKPMAVSFQCMTKSTTNKKKIKNKKIKKIKKKKNYKSSIGLISKRQYSVLIKNSHHEDRLLALKSRLQ